jgi:hypothetical protein
VNRPEIGPRLINIDTSAWRARKEEIMKKGIAAASCIAGEVKGPP